MFCFIRRSSHAVVATGLLLTLSLFAQAQDGKQQAFKWIDENSERLIRISDQVWEFAETALQETRSAELLARELEDAGFAVERGVAGLPTAFVARWGEGRPVIGILGEYDALPSLSQAAGLTEKKPLVEGGAGHGCGHNLFGAATVGAAIAVRQIMEKENIPGTLVFYGCPAEETVYGKTVMAKAGLFDELDAAVAWHPGSKNEVSLNSSLAMNSFEVTFHGRTAHGASDPWNGRSALDAVELMNYGVNMMREHVEPTVRIHYVIKQGGAAPNVVPDTAVVWYYVRALDRPAVEKLYKRVLKIAEGAALATETEFEVKLITGVHNVLVNETIAAAFHRNLTLVGAPDFDESEHGFAKALQKQFGAEEKGLNEEVRPLEKEPYLGGGSTDVAEASWIAPLGQFNVACAPEGTPWHSWVVVSCSGGSIGHKCMITAAKVLAATTLDLLTDEKLLAAATEEFQKDTEGKPYASPLDSMK
jgi:aminobenzoyl-glutamate utilization protein B